ncbi:hypothetical protein FMM79_10390 [Novosphingobium sp. BW1]|nr:hypothetical protein FMM79_10390 [Novosphingobium sp. BW1]
MWQMARKALRAAAGLALLVSAPLNITSASDDFPVSQELRQRSAEILTILNGGGDPATTFAASFRKAVPDVQIQALIASLQRQLGMARGIEHVTPFGEHEATLRLTFEKGTARAWIALSPQPPGQVTGLRVTGIMPTDIAGLASLDEVAAAFAAMPGEAGFLVQNLDEDSPAVALRGERPLAIGSAFKLVILAELVREIDNGVREWSDTITLDGRELPAGGFRAMPPGTQVRLRRLAEEMIRVSDNSATDVLLAELGRTRIEAMQARIGFTNGARNIPFLSTMEAFKLKGVNAGALGRHYLAQDINGRRAILAGDVADVPGRAVGDLFANGHPVMIERLEWFASPADLARAMRWFKGRQESANGREALRILALNPGPAASLTGEVDYAGFKGGSEPGVVNMTVLLENRSGRWMVVTASLNDPRAGVDEARFQALFTRALELAVTG